MAVKQRKVQPIPIGRKGAQLALETGMPANTDAERFILGSVLLDDARFIDIAGIITNDDFALEKHRRIFARMSELHERGEKIDRVTVANELLRWNELESVDGLSYLVSLDDGLPHISNLDSYVRIVRQKAVLRRIAVAAQQLMNRALMAEDDPQQIIAGAEEMLQHIAAGTQTAGISFDDIPSICSYEGQKIEWLLHTVFAIGTVNLISADSGAGKTSVLTAICDAIARGVPFAGLRTEKRLVLYLDRENPLPVTIERNARMGIQDSAGFKILGGWGTSEPPLPSSPGIIQWVNSCEAKPVIVVDSFSAFSGVSDENDAAQVRTFMNGLRRLADKGATIFLAHHTGKGDSARDYRGSSDIKASIDVGYHLANLGEPSRLSTLRLRAFKARFAVAPEIVLHYEDGCFRLDSRAPAVSVTEMLQALLIANPRIGSTEFEDLANQRGIARNNARKFIVNGSAPGGPIRIEKGPHNSHFHTWAGSSSLSEIEEGL